MPNPEAIRLVKGAWRKQIDDLTDAELLRGLEAMDVGKDAWPPGPRAFRKLCRSGGVRREGAHVLFLPEPPPTEEQREAARVALRESLEQLGVAGSTGPAASGDGPRPRRQRGTPEQRREFVQRHRDVLVSLLGDAAVANELGER